MATTRTDIHRPSAPEFDPEKYDCWGVYDNHPEEGDGLARMQITNVLIDRGYRIGHGSSHNCGHCGQHIRYCALMIREDVKQYIWVGEDCLSNRFDSLTKAEFDRLRKAAELNRQRRTRQAAIVAMVEAQPLLAWLTYRVNLPYPGEFLDDAARRFLRDGTLSERYVAAIERAIVRDTERNDRDAERARQAAELAAAGVQVPTGKRIAVEGVVALVSWRNNAYGGTWKMLVLGEAGWKIWSSVPASVVDDAAAFGDEGELLKGRTIRFTATVEQAEQDPDPLFGFASRPTKATVL